MVTTIKGNTIDINGTTEWLLFHRLTKKINPVEFLTMTDALIQLPNFLYTVSTFIMLFIKTDLWMKFAVPSILYFLGQMMINFRFGIGDLKLLKYPLMFFSSGNIIFMSGIFITCFFFIGWWTVMVIPVYILTLVISVTILNAKEKQYYRSHWQITTGYYDIFKNNAFLVTYKYYAEQLHLEKDTSPTDEETDNQVWLKSYDYMLANWDQLEKHFNVKAKGYWRSYLDLNK